MDHTMKKKRIRLFGILAALLLLIGGAATAATVLLVNPSSSNDMLSGDVQVGDEEALRRALKSEGDCTITITEDIVVSKELVVNGDKKLSGAGSIIMNRHRVGSGESVLAIQKGASVVLDGATVDGNGVVNCVSVKAGGSFESVSGSLIYGYPYGLDVSGTAEITDIHIDEAMHTGINVAIFGEVDMLGGTISNNVYGVAVAEEGRMDIAEGVAMTNSYASFIINYGTMDVEGGKYDGAGDNAIENWGTMTVIGTETDPVEICNGTKSAINSKSKSKLTVEHIKIYDMGWHGMCIEKNSTATLKNIYVENAGKSTLYVSSSKANMENITVIGGAAYAIYGTKNAEVTLNHVTIKDVNHRGINNEKSTLVAEDLTIDGAAQHGIYTTGENAVTTVNNVTITNTARSAVAISSGKGTITNATIENTTKEAVSVGALGTVIVEDATINNAGNFAIASYGGVAKATNVEMNNSGNASVLVNDSGSFTGDGLTIKNAGKQAIRIEKGGVAKITGCNIDTTQAASVYVDGGKLTLKSAVINNSKTYGVAAKNCKKASGQIVQLDNVTVNKPGEHGIGSINAYMVAGNIKVTNPRRCGVYSEGAEAIINMANVEVYKAGTCGLGFNGAAEITARNVTIDSPNKEGIYATSGAVVKKLDNITVNNPGTFGISVDANSTVTVTVDTKYNPDNKKGNGVTVLNPGKNGIRCSSGTVSATGVTIKNAGGQAISANKESKVTVNGCTIDTTVQAAVYAEDSTLKLKDTTIDNAGTYGVAAKNCSKEKEQIVQLTDVQINKPGEHGIGSINAYMVAGDIKITESGRCGVYSEGEEAIINMANIEVHKPGTSGLGFKGAAEITARNVTIENAGEHGIYVLDNSVVKKLDNITIEDPVKNGVFVDGNATVVFTVDTEYNPENTKGNGVTILNPGQKGIRCDKGTVSAAGVTIKNAGEHGIYAVEEGKVTVNGCTIDKTVQAAVYADDSTLKLKNATIDNAGTYGVAAKNCKKEKEQIVQLDGVEIDKPGEHGIGSINAYMVAGNVKVTAPKRCGVYTEGEEAFINMAGIQVYDAGTCGFGFNGAAEITARNVTIDSPKNEGILVKGNANVKKLDNVVITKPGTIGMDVQSGTVKITVDTNYNPDNTTGNGLTVENAPKHGINISKGTTVTADGTTIIDSGERGISSAGTLKLEGSGVTIDETVGHGIYMSADASTTGSGLTVKNAGDNGIFSEGGPIDITGLTIENTKNQGVQVKGGTIQFSDFTMKETGSAAMRVRNDAKVTMADGTIYAYSYGIVADGTSETAATNVTVERAGKDGKYTTNPLVHVDAKAKVEITDTVIDGKYAAETHEHKGRGVELKGEATFIMNSGAIQNNTAESGAGVAMIDGTSTAPIFTMNGGTIIGNRATTNGGGLALTNGVFTLNEGAAITGNTAAKNGGGISMSGGTAAARPSFILNGGVLTANTAEGGADMNCTGGSAKIKLGKAIAAPIQVKPNTYATTRLMAEKYGDISDADFESSMNKILVDPNNGESWIVAKTGYLAIPAEPVATIGEEPYATLEEAVAAANNAAGAVTITVLTDVTVANQLEIANDVTIVSGKTDGALTITGSASVFKVAADKSLTVTGTAAAPITIVGNNAADAIYNEGTVKLTHVNISGGKQAINTRAGSSVTMTNVAIENTANNAINIASGANVTLSDVSVTNAGNHGISTGGSVTVVKNVSVEGTTKCGVYMAETASLTGSGLTIKNAGTAGIQADDENLDNTKVANIDLSNLSVEKTAQQGVYFKSGTVVLSNFTIKETGSAAVRPMNNAKVNLTDGTIYADTYGVAVDGTTETVLTNVTVERTGKKTNPLVNIAGSAKLEIAGTTKLDNKSYNGNGINLDSASATLILNGGSFIGETEGYVDVVLNKKDATISLAKALAESVSVKPAEYTVGLAISEKYGEISDADFGASMALLIPADANWIVDAAGKLAESVCDHVWGDEITTQPTCTEAGVRTFTCSVCGDSYTEAVSAAGHTVSHVAFVAPSLEAAGNIEYWYCTVCSTYWKDEAQTQVIDSASVTLPQVAAGNVAYMNGTAYTTLEAAVAAASEGDTIHLLDSTTINAQIKPAVSVTIKAAKPVTITANIQQAFYVDTGKNFTMEGSGSNKITVTSNLTGSNDHVFVNKGTMNLTNVATSGGYRGLYIAGGTVDVNNVTIENTTNHGVYMAKNTTLTGSGLTLETIGSNGIFSEGSTVTIDGLKITNTGGQAVLAKGGVITISNFEISGTGSAALRPSSSSGVKFILTNGTVTTDTYGLAMDNSKQEVALTNVTFVRTGTSTVAVLNVTSSAILTADNVTVNIPSEFNALNINGANTYTGITVVTEE